MQTRKIFLASSAELKADRDQFEIFIGRKNKDWSARGVFLELVMWEDFVDAMSQTRLQDEYNKAIAECDLFVMLFWTKVGRYTAEEFEHIKLHPTLGARILRPLKFLDAQLAIVELHHERPDGRGYPHGLKGDEIPLFARIVHVADAFDAMTSDRSYRKGMPVEAAFAEVGQQGGHQFDPECAQAFLQCQARISEEWQVRRQTILAPEAMPAKSLQAT